MKFRFCGGLEPPDWVLAEVPLLSGKDSAVKPNDLVALCEDIAADTAQELDHAKTIFEKALDAKAAVAVLRFILMHAAKYDIDHPDLIEELQQLGMQQDAAKAIAQTYEGQRRRLRGQQRAQRFQFPGVEKLEWQEESSAKVRLNLTLDQPVVECTAVSISSSSTNTLSIDTSQAKFLALHEELSQAQSMLRSV